MKNKLLFFFALLFNSAFSQCLPDVTDPNYVNYFNWEIGQTLPINTFCQPNSTTINPFNSSQVELLPISLIQDFKKQDGWEAVAYNLGYDNNNQPLTARPEHSYFMLYNKNRGILRILVKWCRNENYSGASLTLGFTPNFETNLLDMGTFEKPILSEHTAGANLTTALKFYNDNSSWSYADFKMNYDPCTCTTPENARLRLYTELIENSNVTLSGSINGTIVSASQNNGQVNSNGAFWSKAENIANKMIKAHKGIEDFRDDYADIFKDLKDNGLTIDAINYVGDLLKNNSLLKAGLSALPKVGKAVKFISALLGGGAGSQGPLELAPLSVNLSVDLNGTISTVNPMHNVTIGLPGSEKSDFFPGTIGGQPLYDETMGIFALIDEPKMYYKDTKIYDKNNANEILLKVYHTVRDYKFDGSELRYKINPASNFELQDAEFMVMSEYQKPSAAFSNVDFSPYYKNPADDNYYDLNNGLNLSIYEGNTTYGDLNKSDVGNCVDRTNFIFQNSFPVIGSKHFNNNYSFNFLNYYYVPESLMFKKELVVGTAKVYKNLTNFMKLPRIKQLKLKIILNLKRTDDPNAQNLLYVVTYPIKLIEAPSGYNMQGANYLADAKSYKDNPDNGTQNKFRPITDQELTQVCQSTVYQKNRKAGSTFKLASEKSGNVESTNSDLIVYPNPFTDYINIEKNGNQLLNLISRDGRILKTFDNSSFESKNNKVEIDLSKLEKGIYFLSYKDKNGEIKSQKLIK